MLTTNTERSATRGHPGLVFGVAIGVLFGVLTAVLFAPSRPSTQRAGNDVFADATDNETGAPRRGDRQGGSDDGAPTGGPTGDTSTDGGFSGSTRSEGSDGGTTPATTPQNGEQRPPVVGGGTVKIGVAHLDLGPIRALGPGFNNGDRVAHMESILAAWKRSGAVPVNGRDVKFVYKSFAAFNNAEQRAACVYFAQEKVFAVVSDATFQLGMECLTSEFHIPVVSADGAPVDVYARGAPYLFTIRMSTDRLFRNLVHWAHRRGLLQGRTIGLYSLSDPAVQNLVSRTVRKELRALGYKLAADLTTDNGTASANDSVAVRQFDARGVDLAIILAARPGFMQSAEAQDYHPRYIDSDHFSGTADIALTLAPSSQWDGMYALTGLRMGEWNSGLGQSPAATKCTADYRRMSGQSIDPKRRNAEWISLVSGCDMASVVLLGLQRAGRDLTTRRFAAALEGVGNRPFGLHPNSWSFRTNKHHGVDVHRTLRADARCGCWKVVTGFAPLPVP